MSKPNPSLIELIESRRIALTPEHEGGWHAEVYDDADRPLYEGCGLTIDEAITAALSPAAEALRAFWVGEHDVYAAHTPEQALELCEGHSGMPDTFDIDDVRELTAGELDKPLQEEDGTPCGTVRQMLADLAAPGELVSFE